MEETTINNNNMEEKLILNSIEDAIREELHHNQYEDRLYYENGDVYDCMDEVEEPTDDDWLNAVSNLFDSYTYDIKNTDVDKFKMSDVMNVYRIINL